MQESHDTPWYDHSIADLSHKVATGALSAVAVVQAALARLQTHNDALNALLFIDHEGALAQAAQIDAARAAGQPLGPLSGVPVVVKDNLCTRAVPTTCASRILAEYIPPYDAHVVERLRQAGAVILGKANMDEFAMGSSNENSAFGATRNPWDLTRVPGGSSGASAAAVAARLSLASLGSDTGGSVRQPGAFCGVCALKPTYGRVSRYGLIAFASSLDQVGPMAPRVEDVARVFQVIAGHDPRDATSANAALEDCVAACQSPTGALQGLRVGQLELDVEGGVDAAVCASVDSAVAELKALGCQVSPVRLPMSWHALSVYYLIAPAEASSNLARFDGMRYGKRKPAADLASTYRESREHGFGPEVKRRIMLGTYALSAGYYDAFYLKAQKVRTLIRREFAEAFSHFDVIVGPTTPTAAFRLGEKTQDPLSMYLADLFTLPASLAGLPAMSVPCGLSPEGLPLGLQLVAPAFQEPRLFALAAAYEQRRGPLGVPRLLQA